MAERFLRIARKWLKDAAVLLQYADIQRFSGVTVANALAETVTKPFTKTPGKRADKLISSSLSYRQHTLRILPTPFLLRVLKQVKITLRPQNVI